MKWKFKHFCNYVQLAKCFGHFGNIRIIEIELQTKVFFAALRCASRPLCDHLQLAQILRAQDFLPLRVKFKQVVIKRPIPVTFVTGIRTRNLLFIDINSNNSSEPGWGSCPNEGETIKLEAREIRLNSWWVAPWWWWLPYYMYGNHSSGFDGDGDDEYCHESDLDDDDDYHHHETMAVILIMMVIT